LGWAQAHTPPNPNMLRKRIKMPIHAGCCIEPADKKLCKQYRQYHTKESSIQHKQHIMDTRLSIKESVAS